MGQYYRLSVLSTSKRNAPNRGKVVCTLNPFDYDNGQKLMESCYIGNRYIGAFETLINKENGEYAGFPVVCGGDYADKETHKINGEEVNIYDLSDICENVLKDVTPHHYRYIINEDKKLFVDTEKSKKDILGLRINPLSLLIAEGNGRGGGDFHGKGEEYVGCWARNVVVTSDNRPDEREYKELVVEFKEEA